MSDVKNKKDLKVKQVLVELKEDKMDLQEKKKPNPYLGLIGVIVGLIIFIIVYSKSTGYMGQLLFTMLLWLFGRGMYILPFFIIGLSLYYFMKDGQIEKEKVIYLAGIFLVIDAMLHIASVDISVLASKSFFESVRETTSVAGGIFGSVLGTIEMSFFGQVGSLFFNILITGMLIALMAGKGLVTFLLFIVTFIRKELDKFLYHKEDDDDDDFDEDGAQPRKPKPKHPSKLYSFVVGGVEGDLAEEGIDDSDYTDDALDEGIILPGEYGYKRTFNLEDSRAKVLDEPDEIEVPKPEKKELSEAPIPIEDTDFIEESDFVSESEEYKFPPIDLIKKGTATFSRNIKNQIEETKHKLQKTLKSFGVNAIVTDAFRGPTVTRYEISPGEGVKVSRVSSLADDIALNLAASAIRIEAPIPGKPVIGIEIPNKEPQTVFLREIIESSAYNNFPSKLAFAIGKDIEGNEIVSDISTMPHLLIAGATGSGKSVCINTLIISILYKAKPEEVKLLMIDPKVVELSVYNGIPHLMIPVVTDPKKAAGALNWAVREMVKRYNDFSTTGVRDIKGYNAKIKSNPELESMPNIVIIIDELADLMMTAQNEVEESIGRLAQMARAAGIHLIIATQRPSVDVITGVIKANIPSRLAFAVSSGTDSRTILDMVGAEKLLGKGDMLFYPMGMSKPQRIQGAFVSDKEVESIVKFLSKDVKPEYNEEMIENITSATSSKKEKETNEESDQYFVDAIEFVISKQKASISLIQRQFRIGYNRAARIVEEMQDLGVIGAEDGSKPRKVIWTINEFENYRRENGL